MIILIKVLSLILFSFSFLSLLDFLFIGHSQYLNNLIASVIGVLVGTYLPKDFMVKCKK